MSDSITRNTLTLTTADEMNRESAVEGSEQSGLRSGGAELREKNRIVELSCSSART